jgi:hypothetical protein
VLGPRRFASCLDPRRFNAHTKTMTNPRKPAESIVKVERTPEGGERISVQTNQGVIQTFVTSPSSIAAIERAAETFSLALALLADE